MKTFDEWWKDRPLAKEGALPLLRQAIMDECRAAWFAAAESYNSPEASSLKEIMAVADEKGVRHPILGDDFAAHALNDVLAKLNELEAQAMRGRSN